MKTHLFILVLYLLSLPLFGQYTPPDEMVLSKKEQRQFMKENRIAAKAAHRESMIKTTLEMINKRRFVLKADYISGRGGKRYSVSSTLNFVIVDSTEATLQIGNNTSIGYNGVGGITVEGKISQMEVKEKIGKRSNSFYVSVYINSSTGAYDIHFSITETGKADATVRGSFGGSITFSGEIVPLEKSRIYKGHSL